MLSLLLVIILNRAVQVSTYDSISEEFYKTGTKLRQYGISNLALKEYMGISYYPNSHDILSPRSFYILNNNTNNGWHTLDYIYREYLTLINSERIKLGSALITLGTNITMNDFILSFALLDPYVYLAQNITIQYTDNLTFNIHLHLYEILDYAKGLKTRVNIDHAINYKVFGLTLDFMNALPILYKRTTFFNLQIYNLDRVLPWYQALLNGIYRGQPISPLYFQNRTIPDPK